MSWQEGHFNNFILLHSVVIAGRTAKMLITEWK